MRTLLRRCAVCMAATLVLLLVGCSKSMTTTSAASQPAADAKSAAPPQVVPAKTAFASMYTAAHSWAPDVILLKVSAKELPGYKNEAGKAAMWEGVFASPNQRAYRVYTYSIVGIPPEVHKGVAAGLKMPWGGETNDAMPVDLSLFNVDSDTAYTAASTEAAAWLRKNPTVQISTLEVGRTQKLPAPVWFVMWGTKKAGYATFVDANTGQVLKHK